MSFRPVLNKEMWDKEMAHLNTMLEKRLKKHGSGSFVSAHEIYGVVMEEVREMEQAIQQNLMGELYAELADVAIACVFGMTSIRNTNIGPDRVEEIKVVHE